MRLNVRLSMEYALDPGDPALLSVTAAATDGQCLCKSLLEVERATLRWIDGEGGRGQRVWAIPDDGALSLRYHARVEITRADVALASLEAAPLDALPAGVLTFLRPSRYCPSDLFSGFVHKEFGGLRGGERIAAIRDWVAASLSYVPGSSHAGTTALDSFVSRQGVCRDYAHLVCGLARAAGIPARYTTGYAPDVDPPDFHAVAEVWLGGAWHLVDATTMSTPGDLVVIGSGRDAGDVPFMETGRWATLLFQQIDVSRE